MTAPVTPDSLALTDDLLDAVVIGGGAAGLNGALMLARSRRSVVVIDSGDPRNAPAEGIHALLGNEGTPPAEYLERGRAEVRQYGGVIVPGTVTSVRAAEPSADGDLRFTVDLADGRRLTARRLLIATGIRDGLPDIPGLAEHWGRNLVHCPFCHGWEVRDQAIGVIATRPMSLHQALMFRALTEDLTVFAADGLEIDPATRERFDALGITLIETPVKEIVADAEGGVAGVRLVGGELVPRSVLTAATDMTPRLDGLDELGLTLEELPAGMGKKIATGNAGATDISGVWVAGNAADPAAQVGASAAGGALAGGHIHGMLVMADADAAVAAHRARSAA
ncbi:NAD(P)/FAD-dependent oxidoreductase [Brachybacterium sp. Z12]|uniref:NAD(P)/FAD-dependent oxidoreductase n=1 Tax=Brachybacterium sp. Z12 TaxID=2759167 RepID=UPI001861460D|nr:NAD(P)/FAD-dependent oxidoreductase [Brachybacterium sp. Z12]QNN82779.1 NAD(P)/FAD-dependent oxidoreductase [Brachybacterium sp. Z12]